jgi:hypothetical protein
MVAPGTDSHDRPHHLASPRHRWRSNAEAGLADQGIGLSPAVSGPEGARRGGEIGGGNASDIGVARGTERHAISGTFRGQGTLGLTGIQRGSWLYPCYCRCSA